MTGSTRLIVAALALTAIAGCAQPPYVPTDIEGPPLPERIYREAARDGVPVYRVDPQRSRVFIRVGRAGPMKSAGHDHVVASEDVDGLVLFGDDPESARADLRLPLQRLVVDRPEYRERFGLERDVSESAINGTTRNMQDKVLESASYPWAEVSARFAPGHDAPTTLAVSITLHGATFEYLVPVRIQAGGGQLSVAGSMTIQHSDFGLDPYSAAGGLLSVAEQIGIEFDVFAERFEPGQAAKGAR